MSYVIVSGIIWVPGLAHLLLFDVVLSVQMRNTVRSLSTIFNVNNVKFNI